MFSSSTARGASSPPRKRSRKLDIAEVSCLVASRQKASFASPERPAVRRPSHPSNLPVSETPAREEQLHTTVRVDTLSQEMVEEDGIIQSSLPQYLDHMFGGVVGGRPSKDPEIRVDRVWASRDYSTTPAGVNRSSCSNNSPPVIQESQGFTVINATNERVMCVTPDTAGSTGACVNAVNEELSPLLFHSPTLSPPTLLGTSGCVNPQTCVTRTHTPSTKTVEKRCNDEKTTPLPVAESERTGNRSKVRKSVAKMSGKKPKYTCPPSCVSLAELSTMKPETLVSILAIVLQGTCIYMYMYI